MGGGSLSISLPIRELLLKQIYLNSFSDRFVVYPVFSVAHVY